MIIIFGSPGSHNFWIQKHPRLEQDEFSCTCSATACPRTGVIMEFLGGCHLHAWMMTTCFSMYGNDSWPVCMSVLPLYSVHPWGCMCLSLVLFAKMHPFCFLDTDMGFCELHGQPEKGPRYMWRCLVRRLMVNESGVVHPLNYPHNTNKLKPAFDTSSPCCFAHIRCTEKHHVCVCVCQPLWILCWRAKGLGKRKVTKMPGAFNKVSLHVSCYWTGSWLL